MMSLKISKVYAELRSPLDDEDAIFEAERCLECRGHAIAPCVEACPAGIDIPEFIKDILEGNIKESAKIIFFANVLGGSCSRVCPTEELCEGGCVLKKEGRRPVSIGLLQRYATDWGFEHNLKYISAGKRKGKSVGVIGGGPAGLGCAAELSKLGYQVTVYEKRSLLGGLLTHANAPYKQLIDPLPAEALAIEEAGVEFKMGVSVGEEPSIEEIEAKHDAIFLGIGLGGDIEVNWEGKDLQGVYNSLEFIERLKLKGDVEVGDCVAVIGGGNTAIDAARESIRLGARDVFILYRRTEREMPAYPHEVEEAKEEGVRFYWLTAPKRFVGNSRVEGIECVYMRLGEPDSSGRRRPQEVKGTEFMMEADTVILALGQQRRTDFLSKIKGLELEGGLVKVNENFQTANPKYFAGGDCVNGGDTVVKAVSHGVKAALGIDLYLR